MDDGFSDTSFGLTLTLTLILTFSLVWHYEDESSSRDANSAWYISLDFSFVASFIYVTQHHSYTASVGFAVCTVNKIFLPLTPKVRKTSLRNKQL